MKNKHSQVYKDIAYRIITAISSVEEGCFDIPMGLLVSVYGICSYAYYENDEIYLSDGAFDLLCKKLLERAGEITDEISKSIYDIEMLRAGSGYHLTKDKLTGYAKAIPDVIKQIDIILTEINNE